MLSGPSHSWGTVGKGSDLSWQPARPSCDPAGCQTRPKGCWSTWVMLLDPFWTPASQRHSSLQNEGSPVYLNYPLFSDSLLSLPRSKPCSISLVSIVICQTALSCRGKYNQSGFPLPHPSVSCFAQHQAFWCQVEFSSSWPPLSKPKAICCAVLQSCQCRGCSPLPAGALSSNMGTVFGLHVMKLQLSRFQHIINVFNLKQPG